jgi:hypothetical protein
MYCAAPVQFICCRLGGEHRALSVSNLPLNTLNLSSFPESATEKLDELLRKPATGKLITGQHRRVIAQICEEAREAGLPVERLVILLKGVLDQTPHSEDSLHSRTEIRERLVSVCIEEYYRRDGKPKD